MSETLFRLKPGQGRVVIIAPHVLEDVARQDENGDWSPYFSAMDQVEEGVIYKTTSYETAMRVASSDVLEIVPQLPQTADAPAFSWAPTAPDAAIPDIIIEGGNEEEWQ